MGRTILGCCPDFISNEDSVFYGPDSRHTGFITPGVFTPTTMPISNLATTDLSQPYRVLSSFRYKTFFEVDFGSGNNRILDLIGVLSGNWDASVSIRAMVSSLGGTGNAYPFVHMLPPTAVVGSTNLTGASVTNIDDDPDNDDELWMTVTSAGTATELHLSFGTPDRNLIVDTLGSRQCFRVRVGLTGPGSETLNAKLYENGSEVFNLGNITVNTEAASGGQLFSYNWDADLLSLVSGANVELVFEQTTTNGDSVNYGAVMWYAALGNLVYDTGDMLLFDDLPDPDNVAIRRNWMTALEGATGRFLRVEISNSAMDYTDVGRAIAGRDLLQGSALTRDISGREYTLDVDYSLSEVSIQQSGQRFVDVRPAPLIRSFAFEMLPRAEAHQMLELIMLRIGVGGELLMIPDDDLTTDQLVFEGIYGYLERASMTPMRATENGVTDVMWNVRLTARELLCE